MGIFHLQFLPFNLNLIYKQQCQKLPGWSKCFLDQGQLIPFLSWREKRCDFEQIHFIKKPHMQVAFRAAGFRVKLPWFWSNCSSVQIFTMESWNGLGWRDLAVQILKFSENKWKYRTGEYWLCTFNPLLPKNPLFIKSSFIFIRGLSAIMLRKDCPAGNTV